MYSVIIDKDPHESVKKSNIKINFGVIYIFLLAISVGLIYFYSVYQNNYLSFLIPYRILWPIAIIFIGISIFRARNKISFSIAFFITTVSVALTITSTFIYSSNIKANTFNNIIPISDASGISTDINLVSAQANINSDQNNTFKADFVSNYDTLISSNYRDENKIENIKLEQTLLQPGIGSYIKNADIIFPNNTPISFNINARLSLVELALSNLKLKSGSIKANNSTIDIVVKEINLDEDMLLEISANLSRININVSNDIPVIISNSSSLTQSDFIGISQDSNTPNVYQTSVQEDISEEENTSISEENQKERKRLIINLQSTLSRVKVTQK